MKRLWESIRYLWLPEVFNFVLPDKLLWKSVTKKDDAQDFLVWDTQYFLAMNKNRSYRANVRKTCEVLVEFINENSLSMVRIEPSDETRIILSDLTEDGQKLSMASIGRWFDGHDRGVDIEDVSSLETALRKIREGRMYWR